MNIVLREATAEDAAFVSKMILMALHMDETASFYNRLKRLVKDEASLYHWNRAIIAIDSDNRGNAEDTTRNEIPVGLCLAYNGIDYHERRLYSFKPFENEKEKQSEQEAKSLQEQHDESGPGEFYIDSLAVIEEYRGKKIGKTLLANAMNEGKEQNLCPTILVDPNNKPALRLYESVGFVFKEEMFVFGQIYWKMANR